LFNLIAALSGRVQASMMIRRSLATFTQKAMSASATLFAAKQHGDAILDRFKAKLSPSTRFSQHGEDVAICELLKDHLSNGFYVDVGANHPSKLSNTYKLYTLGMRGVTIEPNYTFYGLHRRYRPEDLCVCAGLGSAEGVACFFARGYHAVSSFLESPEPDSGFDSVVVARRLVPIITLAGLLSTVHLNGRTEFCLLSVDCEGFDSEVLRGNDWAKFRPLFLLVEYNSLAVHETLLAYMESVGYRLERLMGCNMLFSRAQ
jgi:FkbM family methyltransferase